MAVTKSRKLQRRAVALAITDDGGRVLVVKRPHSDRPLPGVWGLPAVDVLSDEDWETAAHRVGTQKLGTTVELLERLGEERVDRGEYELFMVEFRARINGHEPSVPQHDITITQYTALKYTDRPQILIDAARVGSACARIFLRKNGIAWESGNGRQPRASELELR
jgi:ADP-ribose pyrophosphatase YjhB (NUDIX family)